MKIRNVSPLGDLDVPLLGRTVAAGEQVSVTADQAARLLAQTRVWAPADAQARKVVGQCDEPGGDQP